MAEEFNRFSARDIRTFNAHGLKRYAKLTPKVRDEIVDTIQAVMNDENEKPKLRLEAAKAMARIDALELKHEQTYIPKLDMDVAQLTDGDLDAQIHALQQAIPEAQKGDLLQDYMSDIKEASRKERQAVLRGECPDPEAMELYDPADPRNARTREQVKAVKAKQWHK